MKVTIKVEYRLNERMKIKRLCRNDMGDSLKYRGLAEWFKAAVFKTVDERVQPSSPWVRILLPLPFIKKEEVFIGPLLIYLIVLL